MTKDELSLLIYCEACAVDYTGRVDTRALNNPDMMILTQWNQDGYIESGRIVFEDISKGRSLWCHLSEAAFRDAHAEREERAHRTWAKRTWQTTAEKRGEK